MQSMKVRKCVRKGQGEDGDDKKRGSCVEEDAGIESKFADDRGVIMHEGALWWLIDDDDDDDDDDVVVVVVVVVVVGKSNSDAKDEGSCC
jgi:membrane protein implicated in regulation of membrane protease activity